jgi:hypothetical protein
MPKPPRTTFPGRESAHAPTTVYLSSNRCQLLVAASARSRTTSLAGDPDNYCHDQAIAADWRRTLSETPNDPLVIKLYGLREGLCGFADGRVSLDQATEIWERERAESVVSVSVRMPVAREGATSDAVIHIFCG